MEAISKSVGVTETERMLAEFCERSFLKLWTYPNPFKDDGKELCDVLAVFGDHVFVFFDREKAFTRAPEDDPLIAWDRWKRRAIDRQVVTARGAERYLRTGRGIFLDAKQAKPFPLEINPSTAIVHKIVVSHGAKDACKRSSEQNVYGSLAITYSDPEIKTEPWPFHVVMDRQDPVHVFDSHNMPIVLGELDTITDFSRYLVEKTRAIGRFDTLSYCGEEDLLAHYLLNFDEKTNQHVIGASDGSFNAVMIGEGEWRDFVQSDLYKNTKREDEVSYFWDELIQRTCQNALDGTLGGNSDLLRGKSAIIEMVKEPRFARRALSSKIRENVDNFPDGSGFMRHVSLMPSVFPEVAYVFLQIRAPEEFRNQADYREKRMTLLEIACGSARNKFSHLHKIIGIGVDAPKFAADTAEDFILMPCEQWSEEQRAHYEEKNQLWRFFGTPQARRYEQTVTQFVPPNESWQGKKVGRNDACPCGSGKKYKKCHGKG